MARVLKNRLSLLRVVLSVQERRGLTLDRRQGLQNALAVCVVSAVVSHSMMRQELKPQTRASNERTGSKPMMKQVVLSTQERQGLTLDRWQGLLNARTVCVVYIAVFQVPTTQESQMLTMALKEKEEAQQKVRTWTLTPKRRQVVELQEQQQAASLSVSQVVAELEVASGLNCGLL